MSKPAEAASRFGRSNGKGGLSRPRGGNGRPADWAEVWDNHLSRVVKDNKVTVGKDGWLFLDHDSNAFLRQYSGDLRLSAEQLEQWRQLLESRISRVGELGARYYFMVAPESPSVYPEKLPDAIRIADERTIQQLLAHLASTGSPAKVIYPLEELLAEKPNQPLYPKIDSHWNDYGAFIAYRRLVRDVRQDVTLHEVSEEELHFYDENVLGDLGYKLGVQADHQTCAHYLYAKARKLHDNGVLGSGSLVVVENPHGPPTTCVLFGDSFSDLLVRLIGQSFGRVVWSWSVTVDDELVRQERPDVVISEMSERFLIKVPDDAKKSTRELEAEKRGRGKVRPGLPDWDPVPPPPEAVRVPSIEIVETIRAYLLSRGRQEDATLVSVIAYAGLSPSEALRLSWRQIVDGTLTVGASPVEREGAEAPDCRRRQVRLLEPLADDLAAWRATCGTPGRGFVFPQLRRCDWRKWMRREYRPAVRKAGRPNLGPDALSDVFAALLIHDGVSPSDVATFMGIKRGDVVERYWYLLAETTPNGNAVKASERIRQVRASGKTRIQATPFDALVRLRRARLSPRRLPASWRGALPPLTVEPLTVETVERMRARLLARENHEAATFVSVMAYAGLLQKEALNLKWREVKDGELRIEIATFAERADAKRAPRSVPLLEPLAEDLAEWHAACGSPQRGWVFADLRERDWQGWIAEVYRRAARPSVDKARRFPSYLCQTFWSLLGEQGTPLEEAARQMGLPPEEALDLYGDFFDGLGEQGAVSASARIRSARTSVSISEQSRLGRVLAILKQDLTLSGTRTLGTRAFPLPKKSAPVPEDP